MPRQTKLNRPEAMAKHPPPKGVTGEARALWINALQARPAVEWNAIDIALLKVLVEAISDVWRLNLRIAETSEVIEGRVNPLVYIRAAREKVAITAATKLRLLPAQRHTSKDATRFAAHGAKAAAMQATLDEDDLLAGCNLQ